MDPLEVDLDAALEPGMIQGFNDRQIGIGQADIFANQTNLDGPIRTLNSMDQISPRGQIRFALELQQVTDSLVQTFVVHDQRDLIDAGCVGCVYDCIDRNVAQA